VFSCHSQFRTMDKVQKSSDSQFCAPWQDHLIILYYTVSTFIKRWMSLIKRLSVSGSKATSVANKRKTRQEGTACSSLSLIATLQLISQPPGGGRAHFKNHWVRYTAMISIVSQHFMKPKGSTSNSQELSTCSYPEPDQSSPHHPIPALQDPS
jgi:hypothetical protein